MTAIQITITKGLGVAALGLACLMLLPAAAQAQYPYDWHAATPPSWFTESVDSSCHIREEATSFSWSLTYASDPDSFFCEKPLPVTPELGPGYSLICAGRVSHNQFDDGHPDIYSAIWECYVTPGELRLAACERILWYEESPLGVPNEAFNMDSGGWYDADTFEPDDCRPSPGSENDDELVASPKIVCRALAVNCLLNVLCKGGPFLEDDCDGHVAITTPDNTGTVKGKAVQRSAKKRLKFAEARFAIPAGEREEVELRLTNKANKFVLDATTGKNQKRKLKGKLKITGTHPSTDKITIKLKG